MKTRPSTSWRGPATSCSATSGSPPASATSSTSRAARSTPSTTPATPTRGSSSPSRPPTSSTSSRRRSSACSTPVRARPTTSTGSPRATRPSRRSTAWSSSSTDRGPAAWSQRGREAERLEQRRAERRDLGDPPVHHPQDVELERAEGGLPRGTVVARRGGLAVGMRRQQPPLAGELWPERALHEAPDLVATLVQERERRHRDPHVVRDEGERGVGVAALVRVDEPLEHLALRPADLRRPPVLAAAGGQLLAEGPT